MQRQAPPANVAFVMKRLSSAEFTAAIRAAIAPSTTAIMAIGPKVALVIPVPWVAVKVATGADATIVGEGYIQLALYDLLEVNIPGQQLSPWFLVRINPQGLNRLMHVATDRGCLWSSMTRWLTSAQQCRQRWSAQATGPRFGLLNSSSVLPLTSASYHTLRMRTSSGVSH